MATMEGRAPSKVSRRRTGGKRSSPIDLLSIYDYALRCAILGYLEQTESIAVATSLMPKESKRERLDRLPLHMSVSGVIGSFTDKFSEDANKPDRLTKEIVRGLQRRLDDVKKGKNLPRQGYDDQVFMTLITQFQATTLKDKRYRPTGTVNDLVIDFATVCKAELKNNNNSGGALLGEQLNKYMARFAQLVLETIQDVAPSSATPELLAMLHSFIDPPNHTKRTADLQQPTAAPASPIPRDNSLEALQNFSMVKTVKELFQVDDAMHYRKLKELQPICTEAAFIHDLKTCINNINLKTHPFPGRREDFISQEAYDIWQKREVKQLQELMRLMLLGKGAGLGTQNDSDGSSYSLMINPSNNRNSIYGTEGHISTAPSTFTFIPSDPRMYFQQLMNMCVEYDYTNDDIPDYDRAKSSILSPRSDELLRECWKTWRLSASYRAIVYLDIVNANYQERRLPLEDVMDAARSLDKIIKENDPAYWTINDREKLIQTYERLNSTLLKSMAKQLSKYWSETSAPFVYDILGILDKIYESPVYLEEHPDPICEFLHLEETIEGAAVNRWRDLERETNKVDLDALTNLYTLADRLIKELVSITKRKFKTPLKGILSVPGIVMAKHMSYFALEIENWAYSPESRNAPIERVFEFYHKVLSLKRLYDQHGPKKKTALFKVESWFLTHVRRWLITTHSQTTQWVTNAIEQDQFKPVSDTAVHSSSVVDLFSMFHQAVDFVQNLQWPNEIQRCRFLTQIAKTIANALDLYTQHLDSFIRNELDPPNDANSEHSGRFLGRAHNLIGGHHHSKGTVPVDFRSEVCIMINDLEAARGRLDRLYQLVDVDEISDYMQEFGTRAREKTDQTNLMYSIRVVRAENLMAADKNGLSDPFVILKIKDRYIGKTETKYETLNPRWEQSFDVWINEPEVEVVAVVYDEDFLVAKEKIGTARLLLNQDRFGDHQIHDLSLPLDTQGSLFLRVSLVGENDDIRFWFVKAFRALKWAENEAAVLIVNRMSEYMRQHLSKKTMDRLLRRERGSIFSSFMSSRHAGEISLQEKDCEDAIASLLDYLEVNLKILNDNLSDTNMQFVVLKIWKEVLRTLEGVLTPRKRHLSDPKPLDDYEEHVLFKWLELLKIFFNGGQDGDAVPLDKLESPEYVSLINSSRRLREMASVPVEGY